MSKDDKTAVFQRGTNGYVSKDVSLLVSRTNFSDEMSNAFIRDLHDVRDSDDTQGVVGECSSRVLVCGRK